MANNQTRVQILAQIEGLDGIEKLKSSFRGLNDAIGPADEVLSQARREVLEFARAGAQTDQVLRGTIQALRGLVSQAEQGGSTYKKLVGDLAQFEGKLRNSTLAVNQQIEALQRLSRYSNVADFRSDTNRSRAQPGIRTVQDTFAARDAAAFAVTAELDQATNLLNQGRQRLLEQDEKYFRERLALQEQANNRQLELQRQADAREQQLFLDRLRATNLVAQTGQVKGQLGLQGRDLSPLYQSVVGIGTSRAQAGEMFMGRPAQQVLQDISTTFNGAGGFTGFGQKSTNELNQARQALSLFRSELDRTAPGFKNLERTALSALKNIDRELERRDPQGGLAGKIGYIGQGIGAAASAGIFGGPEGLIAGVGGGAVGALLGGPAGFAAGSFIGSSVGAYAGMGRQRLGEFATFSADIAKQELALKGVTKSVVEYQNALAAVSLVVRDFNVPQQEATASFTRLSASVIGAGGNVADAEVVFRNVTAAIKASGGSAQDVQASLTALSQIFSKGKVSAEELQGQLGERLPGAVTMFAKATGRTLPQLQKDLEQGVVGLNDLMKFVTSSQGLGQFEERAKTIAKSSEDAGARLVVAWNKTRQEIGKALAPLGADIQNSFASLLSELTPALVSTAKGLASAIKAIVDNASAIGSLVRFVATLGAVNIALKAMPALIGGARIALAALAAQFGTTSAIVTVATARLVALRASLLSLGRLGLITVGINVIVDGLNKVREVQERLDQIRSKGTEAYAREIGGSALSRQEIDAQLQQNRAELKRRQEELASVRFPLLTGQDEIAKTAIADLENRYQKLQTMRERALYGSPADRERANLGQLTQFAKPEGKESDKAAKEQEKALKRQLDYENDLFNIRLRFERRLAEFREQSLERAKDLERDLGDQRLDVERQTNELRRRSEGQFQDFLLKLERNRVASIGGDTSSLDFEIEMTRVRRDTAEQIIRNEQEASDRRLTLDRAVEDYRLNVAKGIRDIQVNAAEQWADRVRQGAEDAAERLRESSIGGSGSVDGSGPSAGVARLLQAASSKLGIFAGQTERCADAIRELFKVAGIAIGTTKKAWDGLGSGPRLASSFFGSDIGQRINNKRDLRPGDLVGFERTYGSWGPGVQTHVGMYAGNGMMFDHSSRGGLVRRPLDTFAGKFMYGVRPYALMQGGQQLPANGIRPTAISATRNLQAELRSATPMQPMNAAMLQVPGIDGVNAAAAGLRQASDANLLAANADARSQGLAKLLEQDAAITQELGQQKRLSEQQLEDYQRILALQRRGLSPELAQQSVERARMAEREATQLQALENQTVQYLQQAGLTEEQRKVAQLLLDATRARATELPLITGALQVEAATLERLRDLEAQRKQLIEGITGSISNGLTSAMDALIDGTENWGNSLRGIASGVLRDIAKQLVQIYAVQPATKGLQGLLGSLLGGGSPGAAVATAGAGASVFTAPLLSGVPAITGAFANGGIMTDRGPLPLRAYANGGIATGPQLALFGEGRMNEAYVPLPDGRRIPVAMQGGGGGSNVVNVTVNAEGSAVQGDSSRSEQLGQVVARAIQEEMIRQRRPGGLLA
jgi:tape measure domain-containing protein